MQAQTKGQMMKTTTLPLSLKKRYKIWMVMPNGGKMVLENDVGGFDKIVVGEKSENTKNG